MRKAPPPNHRLAIIGKHVRTQRVKPPILPVSDYVLTIRIGCTLRPVPMLYAVVIKINALVPLLRAFVIAKALIGIGEVDLIEWMPVLLKAKAHRIACLGILRPLILKCTSGNNRSLIASHLQQDVLASLILRQEVDIAICLRNTVFGHATVLDKWPRHDLKREVHRS